MTKQPNAKGPAGGILGIISRVATIVAGMVETRLRLVAIELEESKATLVQLFIIASIALLFAIFGLAGLLVLIIWSIDPTYRLIALAITTAILLILALVGIIWALVKVRRTSILGATRKQLAIDCHLLGRSK
ncbi:phage holin family protein [Candidatus Fukatsuia symbiotica]|uniref:Phage holin family protein n=1 Tax=Candidatus Fukatsuia symbiotica TaxID=1878942 RepID=A0A2U8I6W1_9GAMM|nr:phage holin family protein [Candidatus Fukatsuia symbiotica]AWK14837.1 hypothetical protein CCS41_10725 [Candidatus Fukatsuia symbiotica]MEA9445177.1 phage holin family protein [Candidatus Fukatsuia symbiotica]